MSDTGQLQRLTEEQVSARLAAYNGDRKLERDIKLFREDVLGIVVGEIKEQFGPERADRYPVYPSAGVLAPISDWRHNSPKVGVILLSRSGRPTRRRQM